MKGSVFDVDSCDIFTTVTGTIVWIAVPVTCISWNILGSARETLANPVRGSFVNYHFSDFYLPHQWVHANRTGLRSIHLNGNVVLIKMLFTGSTGSFHLDNSRQWWKFRHYFGCHSDKIRHRQPRKLRQYNRISLSVRSSHLQQPIHIQWPSTPGFSTHSDIDLRSGQAAVFAQAPCQLASRLRWKTVQSQVIHLHS